MEFIYGTSLNLPKHLLTTLARYRYEVFVKKLGWPLACRDNLELDEFDHATTLYVIARNEAQQIVGAARLLPTTRPYLLSKVFPQLLADAPPNADDIWELSRFAAVDLNSPCPSALGHVPSSTAVNLLRFAMQCAIQRGAKRLITVSPLGVERILRRTGFRAHRAGPVTIIDGHAVFACWIDCVNDLQRSPHRETTAEATPMEQSSAY